MAGSSLFNQMTGAISFSLKEVGGGGAPNSRRRIFRKTKQEMSNIDDRIQYGHLYRGF